MIDVQIENHYDNFTLEVEFSSEARWIGILGASGSGKRKQYPYQISGEQQQRVALARILATRPKVILLDEPFSALDESLRDRMQQELQNFLSDFAGTILMVSHSRDEIYRMCEETVVIANGKVIASGKTRELFANPGKLEVAKLTGCKNYAKVLTEGNTLVIPDWGVRIDTISNPQWKSFAKAEYIGVRAHDLVPVWGQLPAEAIKFDLKSEAELLFESKFFIRAHNSAAQDICWFVTREQMQAVQAKGYPAGLRLPADKAIVLMEN